MLVFWTMERSLPSGRRPGPAGRPQRTRGRRNRERRGAAQPAPDPATWPCLRLPSSCRPSLLPLAPLPPPPPPPPPKAQHLPPPLRPPRPRPPQPLRRLRADNGRAAGGKRAPPGLRPARVQAATRGGRGGVRNSPEGRGPGVAVGQRRPSANGGVTWLGVAGTAPPFRPKPLFLAGLPIPAWAPGSSRSQGPGLNCFLPWVSPGRLEPNKVPSPPLTLGWPARG